MGGILAFQANIPEEFVKRLGDWQSDALRSYIHIPVKYRMHAIRRVALFVINKFILYVYRFFFFCCHGVGRFSPLGSSVKRGCLLINSGEDGSLVLVFLSLRGFLL